MSYGLQGALRCTRKHSLSAIREKGRTQERAVELQNEDDKHINIWRWHECFFNGKLHKTRSAVFRQLTQLGQKKM